MHDAFSFRPGTRRFLRALCLLCLMVCIFFTFANSLQAEQESDRRSGEVTSAFSHLGLDIDYDLVRKAAHFLEFALLGFLSLCCLRVLTPHLEKHVSWPLLLGLVVALIDESIQLFVPGRAGIVPDIWVDFGGVIAGILLGAGFTSLTRRFWSAISLDKG